MRTTCLSAIAAAVALTLVAACGATDRSDGQGTAQGTAPGIAQITATIEKAGFTCEVKERHPDRFAQVADCRSNQDKYLKLIASEWKDPAARDEMYGNDVPGMCGKLGLKDQVRWSTSGSWALVAGASKEKDVNALDAATAALGFEPHAVRCR